jgi:hypothetical protein
MFDLKQSRGRMAAILMAVMISGITTSGALRAAPGNDTNSPPSLHPGTTVLVGTEADAGFGRGLGPAGDINGDGFSDLFVGAPSARANRGRVELFLGSGIGLQPKPAWVLEGREVSEQLGLVISGVGDINGDGFSDFMVSRVHTASTRGPATWVELYLGSTSGPVATKWRFLHEHPGFYIGGRAVPAGDVNGDRIADVLIGSHMHRSPPDEKASGTVFVFYGSKQGLADTPNWSSKGPIAGDGYGAAIAGAGDVNGDRIDDLIIGAPLDDQAGRDSGRIYVFHGSLSGLSPMPNWSTHSPLQIRDAYSSDQNGFFGAAVASAGDVNRDGFDDILVGAHFAEEDDADEGVAFLFLGSASGLKREPQWIGQANQPFANFGIALHGGGDLNGDGHEDVLVAAPYASDEQQKEGFVGAWMGSSRGLKTEPAWTGEADRTEDCLGEHLAFLGDVNKDGFADVAISQAGFRDDGQYKGRVVVKYGSPDGLKNSSNWRVTKPWTLRWQQWWDRGQKLPPLIVGTGCTIGFALTVGMGLYWLRQRDTAVAAEARRAAFHEAARDVHDEIGPLVTTLGALVADPGPATDLANRLESPLIEMGDALDHLAWKWKSEGTDLRRTVDWMFTGAARIAGSAGLKVVTEMGALRAEGSFPEGGVQQIQSCLREAVTNVVKHARASTVFLRASMVHGSMMRLEVEDDGQGMSTASGSPGQDGLQNLTSRMRQIGGRCEVAAEPGRGVLIWFEIPLGNGKAKA